MLVMRQSRQRLTMIPECHLLLLAQSLQRQITHTSTHSRSLYILSHLLFVLPTSLDRKIDNTVVSLFCAFQIQLLGDIVSDIRFCCVWKSLTNAASGFGEDGVLGGEKSRLLLRHFGSGCLAECWG